MQDTLRKQLAPGTLVAVTQQIPHRDRVWSDVVRGTVVSFQQKQTGSWFAHSKNDKLWLDRLVLRREDGEIITLNLDEYTHIEFLGPGGDASGGAVPAAETTEPAP